MNSASWFQQARLKAIEIISFWQGRINTREIMDIFGVSRVIAQKDIHQYIEQSKGNLIYQRREKAYFITGNFENMFSSGSLDELSLLDKNLIYFVEKPNFNINPELIRPIIQAIRKNNAVKIEYYSMTTPTGSQRILFPHSLVYSGFRWHIRAWCCTKNEFRDFNLNRITKAYQETIEKPVESDSANDTLWNTIVNIELVANPEFSEDEKKLIEFEFKMTNNRLIIPVKAALVEYTLQAYQVDKIKRSNQYEQRLLLNNKKELETYLWKN
ncbi:helix-turn-helix transcriptional regulator [Methylobacter sp. YRD-M1]|uniref:helix-turn-helix transcriptional regulator n=1 Tax=Methylobacter sp. YRD-M1 TaxID=2911520 RepID=UPI00227D6689|nr:WYL domain-containing protein [Methylobacter sp. YRD-M1]WAK02240.1 WYL domain-containing protein [Methylobacter sp. YRD-M1]